MRVLQCHNRYQQTGGEDVVVQLERELLETYQHQVDVLEADNTEITGPVQKVKAALTAVYSFDSKHRVMNRIAEFRPDVVHVHNFFPLISPSVYYACREAGVPIVQTLHNYRLICPNAQLLRNGRICEDCVGRSIAWPSVVHACYRDSTVGSASVAGMIAIHRWLGTWKHAVDAFIATTEFSRTKLVEGGLPKERIAVKPNFVLQSSLDTSAGPRDYALFVGRLSEEKGIRTLLSAWNKLKPEFPLKVAGEGPLLKEVQGSEERGRIEYLRAQHHEQIQSLMRGAAFLVVPSVCYEGLPLVIVEAFSVGLPVIASGHGSLACVVKDRHTGLLFRPGEPDDLARKIDWAVSNPKELLKMGRNARTAYLIEYTPERNYEMLMNIYRRVISARSFN